ncbi:hypothetical protein SSX86_021019 [Deinandra increscens subsp. villosa]|uniref:Dynamin-type G domain-containing protein n=1 Tax=Deinandra increscens subsp. villosa TaxID=3103831 RepID=A0AAP0GVC6_9ASTR
MADVPPPPSSPSSSNAAPLGHNVIPIVNKLQDIFAQLRSSSTIELAQVAVVGSQSSGKSSVLEALVDRDFFPRGSDICTRRPLVLQLLQTKRNPDGADEEYGEFLHVSGKRFYNFNDIRKEIQEAGGNKGVSDKQIRLKIFSPNVLDITLVDLPGITKVPVGDQSSDIEARIRTMIMSYIKLPSCLILAITPANSDLANSDALQIAGNADPDVGYYGQRYGCSQFFAWKSNSPSTWALGYVGVMNRSQEDTMFNRTIKDALAAEEKFFRSRPVYNELADRCGVPQLAKKLNQILVQHIKTVLPGLKTRISSALVSVAKEHASYGEITESKAGMGALLLNILSKYSEGDASLLVLFNLFSEVDPCEDLTDDDIRTAIQNATGPRSALFVPEVPFEVLIRRQIARLLDPSLHKLIKRFPVLRKRIDDVIGNFLRDGLQPSETMIGHIVEMEMDYINTSHPNFVGGSKAVEIATTTQRQNDGVEAEKAPQSEQHITINQGLGLSVRLRSQLPEAQAGEYRLFLVASDDRNSVKENPANKLFSEPVQAMDHAFSMIHLREVNHTKIELHNVFIKELYRDDLFEQMLQEPDEVAAKRKRTRDMLRVLQQAALLFGDWMNYLPLEAETVERGYSLSNNDTTGLPKIHGFPTSSLYSSSSGSADSTKNHRSRKSGHSGELQSPFYGNAESNGNGRNSFLGLYPTVD